MINNLINEYPKLKPCENEIKKGANMLLECFENGGKLLICGNGGSACDSGHIAGELLKGFKGKRPLSEEEKARLNKLLQFLYSNSSPTNVVFVATTNYPERLDSALTREGRFDLAVNVKGIYYDKAFEMCKSFGFADEKIKRILKEIIDDPENDIDLKNKPINQSKLQGIILKNIEDEAKQVIE